MEVSRTGFLRICGAVLLGRAVDASPLCAAVGGAFAARSPRRPGSTFRMEYASAALFLPHLHTIFTVRATEGTQVPIVLARVTERPLSQSVEQFSLTFHAPQGAPALNGTSAFRHPILGEFDLFIVRVGAASPHRTVYEACFSRYVRVDVLGDDRDVAG